MTLLLQSHEVAQGSSGYAALPWSHTMRELVAPLDRVAAQHPELLQSSPGWIERGGREHMFPRYLFQGPPGGGDTIRIAIFGTIHGDEPEGACGLVRFITGLAQRPELATDYALFLYPVCNPAGLAAACRHAPDGRDLNREFWTDSGAPEVRLLESEICLHALEGIITLHTDDTCEGLYGYVKGAVLSEHLLEPALRAAERYLPRDQRLEIDGWRAERGIIREGFPGVLQSLPTLAQPPFEVTLETPQRAPLDRQVEAFSVALQTILLEYRKLLAFAQNI